MKNPILSSVNKYAWELKKNYGLTWLTAFNLSLDFHKHKTALYEAVLFVKVTEEVYKLEEVVLKIGNIDYYKELKERKNIIKEPQPRTWGTYNPNTGFVEHNGEKYLPVIFEKVNFVTYCTKEGIEIEETNPLYSVVIKDKSKTKSKYDFGYRTPKLSTFESLRPLKKVA